jgi:hypothetical protein
MKSAQQEQRLKNRFRRHLRLYLAPAGSQGDAWFRSISRTLAKARQASLSQVILRLLPGFLASPLRKLHRRWRVRRAVPYQQQALEIVKRNPNARPIIIFPPSLDWNTQLFQRPQQLALAFAAQGALVFYLQPRPEPGIEPFREVRPGLYLCSVPVEAFDAFDKPLIYLLTWNRKYASAFREPQVIYDYVDEIEVFDGDHNEMRKDHARLVQTSHLVIATAEHLYQQVQPMRADALLCPNGVDYPHFSPDQDKASGAPPLDLQPIVDAGRPIVGYYGALALWFDFELVISTARSRPDLSFVIIGPDYDGTLPPALLDLPNVHWLGVKPYVQLPNYVRFFDVATIPFKLNKITHSTSPLKLFEYLAAERPVVITAMHEPMRYPVVLVAHSPAEFCEQIDQALELKDDPDYLQSIRKVAMENTWEARARQILDGLGS